MRPTLRALVCVALLTAPGGALLAEARAHGGTYRGPGAPLPPGATGPGTPTAPSGPGTGAPRGGGGANPATGGGAASDSTGWAVWWGLNREPYLALRTALLQGGALAATGGDSTGGAHPRRPTDAQVRERVAPALSAALVDERNPDVATGALLALAKCGPRLEPAARAAASAAIRARLADPNQEVSETAAVALGILARAGDMPLLGALLQDEPAGREACGRASVPTRTRAFAAYALGVAAERIEIEDVRRWIAHRLVAVLDGPPGASRDLHVAALVSLGLVELGPGAAKTGTAKTGTESIDADPIDGGRIAQDSAAAPTASAAALYDYAARWYADTRRDDGVRGYAPVTLARLALRAGEEQRRACVRLLSPVLETGSEESSTVRQGAVQALGLVVDGDGDPHDARARDLLQLAGAEGDRLARRLAWIALARAGARPGTEGRDALAATRTYLTGLFARGSTPERPWLALAIGIGERAAAARGLDTPSAVHQALARAIREHTSPPELGAHLLAYALAGGPNAGAVLIERLEALADVDTRSHAALALGIAPAPAAIEPLRNLVRASRYEPRLLREAAIALGLLGDTSLTPELVALLAEARGLAALSSVATALGYVGDARAVEPLVALCTDTRRDASARAFACVALGLLGDPRPLPWNTPLALEACWWIPPSTLWEPTTGTGVLDLL